MQQIFIDQTIAIGQEFAVTGEDVKHITQVLRMKPGERLRVSNQQGESYLCEIVSLDKNQVDLRVLEEMPSTELEQKIYLFQAIPKGDRMETVIEKAVELGVYANILSASTKTIGEKAYGNMLLGIDGGEKQLEKAMKYLRSIEDIAVEEAN